MLAAASSSDSDYSSLNPEDVSATNADLPVIGDIANYEFDGDYLDSSGNGRHLQNFGTNFSQGVRNQAVEFGNGKYLKLTGNSSGTIKAISIWIYPTNDSAEQMYFYLSEDRELYLSFGQTYYISFPRSPCGRINLSDLPQLNSWNSFIVNLTGAKIQIYLNGIKKIDSNCTSFVDFSNEKYFIGSKLGSGYYFRGKMDSYKIFGRSLNSTEISALSSE